MYEQLHISYTSLYAKCVQYRKRCDLFNAKTISVLVPGKSPDISIMLLAIVINLSTVYSLSCRDRDSIVQKQKHYKYFVI